MNNEITKVDYINDFRNAFSDGLNSIVKASQIYVVAIDENPKIADDFVREFRDVIPATAWAGFEAVGRKWMHPRLLMGGGGRYGSKIKRLPYSAQEQIFNGGRFDLLTNKGDTLSVDIRELEPEQVDQIIDNNHIRTLSEQRAWLENQRTSDEEEIVQLAEKPAYVISSGKVCFRRGITMTRNEVKRLLQEM